MKKIRKIFTFLITRKKVCAKFSKSDKNNKCPSNKHPSLRTQTPRALTRVNTAYINKLNFIFIVALGNLIIYAKLGSMYGAVQTYLVKLKSQVYTVFEASLCTAQKRKFPKPWNIMESSNRPSKYHLSINLLAEKKIVFPII